jgi:hypothetical protein
VVTIRLVMLSGLASVARLIARDFLANGTPIGHQACDTGGKGRVIAAVDNGLEPDAFRSSRQLALNPLFRRMILS